jgi:hypothetical protein
MAVNFEQLKAIKEIPTSGMIARPSPTYSPNIDNIFGKENISTALKEFHAEAARENLRGNSMLQYCMVRYNLKYQPSSADLDLISRLCTIPGIDVVSPMDYDTYVQQKIDTIIPKAIVTSQSGQNLQQSPENTSTKTNIEGEEGEEDEGEAAVDTTQSNAALHVQSMIPFSVAAARTANNLGSSVYEDPESSDDDMH